jgi:hypothetical protein
MTQHRTGRRPRIWGMAAAAAVLLSAVIGLSGAGQALASGAPKATMSVRVTTVVPAVQQASTPTAATCPPFSRTQLCFRIRLIDTLLINNRPVGFAAFTVTHYLHLNPRGRDYNEQVSIGDLRVVNASGIHVALADGCGNTCTPTGNNFPVGETLRNGLHGTLTFHDSVGKGQEASLRNKYEWLFVKAGFAPGSITYFTPLFYRCDEQVSSTPGCVFPEFIPVMTSMQGLPAIAANIRRIQGHGLHLGEPGKGRPLHRITDAAQQQRNYNFMCPRSRPRPRGKQCDEYPFKTTREGGQGAPANSRGWAMVPAGEQRSQGGRISQFYQTERILDGDAFWVSV